MNANPVFDQTSEKPHEIEKNLVRRGAFARGTPNDMSRKGVLIVVDLWGCHPVIDRQTDKFYS